MTDEPDMLPGLRAAVADSRAKAAATRRRKAAEVEPAPVDPVARVLVDVPLAHLDRPFDYLVAAKDAEAAVPGARVKVRFAGQDVDGFVVERRSDSDHVGRLAPLRRVVSPEPVLTPAVLALVAAVAERYAGSRADVLRLAVPPRHATTEAEPPPAPSPDPPAAHVGRAWAGHEPAAAYLAHLAGGGSPRAVWSVAPATDWPQALAEAAAATLASGRGSLIAVPDHRDVARVDAALTEVLGEGHHVALTAEAGPARRYREFLALSRGHRRVVVGTRAAGFAPVRDLGLVVVWDDGDDLHAEPRAPYPHTREVLLLRADLEGAGVLVAGHARTVEAQQLVRSGWAHEVAAPRATVRERVLVDLVESGERDHGARLPHPAYAAVKRALADGPVLVQAPRAGYRPSLACERCRTPARCRACTGPLQLTAPTTPPVCRWCGETAVDWACGECGDRGLRAPVVGGRRTAEELGRAFPGVEVVTSTGDTVRAAVGDQPALVVATPGAEPVAAPGYAAVVLLDTWLPLARADLRAEEEALRRWLNAAALVRPGGRVVAVGAPDQPALQALVRWDPAGFAEREARSRAEAHLPPASRLATITGDPGAVDDVLTLLDRPDGMEVLGPVEHDDASRVVVRVPRSHGAALSQALGEVQRVRAARKLDAVRVQIDPYSL
ncbi:primosomal protein N' [Nocardioides coralli]|uniref:primosomal protein N' n=1 Tax=Nocardioides coralli TaxID=2872154 RepID=UPI001CA39BE0|nr:primosomal protein N' [Nocardioides coralli]QZY30528.1 primosomal protein N' [Nocardioides coralli]